MSLMTAETLPVCAARQHAPAMRHGSPLISATLFVESPSTTGVCRSMVDLVSDYKTDLDDLFQLWGCVVSEADPDHT